MIFRQLVERVSSTYTYLVACSATRQALYVDPVRSQLDQYLQLLSDLDLRLAMACDTHLHADHITALGALRDQTGCETLMAAQAGSACVSRALADGDVIHLGEEVRITALYTPGHTDDSFCFVMPDRVFTGDTLLIRSTGRTDFQNGDPVMAYHSLFDRLLRLPDETLVYPGHDYRGWTVSTIGEEKAHNPRLRVSSAEEYAALMGALDLPSPALIAVAVPANRACGQPPDPAGPGPEG